MHRFLKELQNRAIHGRRGSIIFRSSYYFCTTRFVSCRKLSFERQKKPSTTKHFLLCSTRHLCHKIMAKVNVSIQYCGGWGYGPYAYALGEVLAAEFDDKVKIEYLKDEGKTGNFEVVLLETGELIHSKKKGGKGRAESNKERAMICDAIQSYLDST